MISLVVTFLQITVIAASAMLLAWSTQRRAPALSAKIAFLGILGSSLALLLAFADLPRWLEIRGASAQNEVQTHLEAATDKAHPILSLELPLGLPSQPRSDLNQGESGSWLQLPFVIHVVASVLIILALGRCCVGSAALWVLNRNSRRLLALEPRIELHRLAKVLQLNRLPALRSSPKVQVPCVCWLRPYIIFVPNNFEQWSALERNTALSHELQHIVRRDAFWRFIGELAAATVVFHPLVWFLKKQLIGAQEIATDKRAAQQFCNTEQYRKGLSMLALRMDSQSRQLSFLEVSVSTNTVVRRIKMLKREPKPLPFSRRALAASALVLVSGFTLAWTAQADDPLRVASVAKLKLNGVAAFSRPLMQPQESLGARNGYFSVRPSLICANATWKKHWLAAERAAKSHGFDLASLGIDQGNLELASCDFSLLVSLVPEAERVEGGDRGSITFGATAFELGTHSAVSWLDSWDSSPMIEFFEPILGDAVQSLEEKLDELGTSTQLSILSKSNLDEQEIASLRAFTALLDGGVMVQSSRINDEVRESLKAVPQDVDPMQMKSWILDTEALGFGVDIDGNGLHQIRVAFMPCEDKSLDEYKSKLKNTLEVCGKTLEQLNSSSLVGVASLSTQLNACEIQQHKLENQREVCLLELKVPSALVDTALTLLATNQP